MHIRKTWLLVVLVSGTQLLCGLVGVTWFGRWAERSVYAVVRQRVIESDQLVAIHLADRLDELGPEAAEPGTSAWRDLQHILETAELPEGGSPWVVRNSDGRMIAHPQWNADPQVRERSYPLDSLQTISTLGMSAEAIKTSGMPPMPGGDQGVILGAVRRLPTLNATLLLSQDSATIRQRVASVIDSITQMAVLIFLAVVLLQTLMTLLIVRAFESRVDRWNILLERQVKARGRALTKTRDAVIFGLARLAESRDKETGEHLERIHAYVRILATELAKNDDSLDPDTVSMMALTSALHDVGKVGIPDAVLLKPGKLTPSERRIIEKHPLLGGDTLYAIKVRLGEDDFLTLACEIAFAHHEHWDGNGYPFGLEGDTIPLSARIVALADVYDALTTERVYKPAMSHEDARAYIVERRGKQFDPRIVDAFLATEADFQAVAAGDRSYRDETLPELPPLASLEEEEPAETEEPAK